MINIINKLYLHGSTTSPCYADSLSNANYDSHIHYNQHIKVCTNYFNLYKCACENIICKWDGIALAQSVLNQHMSKLHAAELCK